MNADLFMQEANSYECLMISTIAGAVVWQKGERERVLGWNARKLKKTGSLGLFVCVFVCLFVCLFVCCTQRFDGLNSGAACRQCVVISCSAFFNVRFSF
jgi:hypothetical protein